MRFDTPIYFQCVQAGKLDENTHNYGQDTVIETKVYANVSTTATETLKIVYGDIKQNSLTIRLQMPYKNVFDRIKVGEKFYKVDSAKQLRNKQVFIVSEVQGSNNTTENGFILFETLLDNVINLQNTFINGDLL